MNSPVEWLLNPELIEKLASPRVLDEAFCDGLRPDPDLTVSQWADANRVLSSESSAEHGLWRTSRVPFAREIMDAQSPQHPCQESALKKGTQIAGSEAMYNVIGAAMDQFPCPILLVMPTTDMAKLTSKQRIQTMIDSTECLTHKVKPARARDSGNTVLVKSFRGGLLRMTGANSGPGLRSMPVRVLLGDEIDAWPADVGGEGDPLAVARKRTDTFGARKKEFVASSPKIKGSSRIDRAYQSGTQAQYRVPCPHCQHLQVLQWSQMRWQMATRRELVCNDCGGFTAVTDDGALVCSHCDAIGSSEHVRTVDTEDLERVWYECESCQAEIDERHKTWMLREWPEGKARHVHRVPGPGRVIDENDPHPHAIWALVGGKMVRYLPTYTRPLSWHVSGLYSPLGWFSWTKAVQQYLEAKKGGYDDESGESLEQVFDNTVLGEAHELEGEQADVSVLSQRAEGYDLGTVPAGGLLLAASIDVQGNRLEYKVKAYGRGEESWLVDFQVLHGDPSLTGPGSVWEQAIELRNRAYPHAGGNSVYVSVLLVDSGYLTQVVYDFCRKWRQKHIYAIKGDAGTGKTVIGAEKKVDFNHRGKPIKNGATVRMVGVDTVKERVFSNLARTEPGPGYMHFPRGLPSEYYEGLTSEKKVPKRRKGAVVYEYIKTRERNEPLDLEVYCYAAAVLAGIKRVNWDQLEQAINPAQRDIFAEAAKDTSQRESPPAGSQPAGVGDEAAEVEAEKPAPAKSPGRRVRRPGFVNSWRSF